MGQVVSRNLTARLAKATQQQENKLMRELLDETLQKKNRGDKYTDPNATVWGFKRGDSGGALQREYEQEKFLKKTNPANNNSINQPTIEMPSDLVDFLKAVGPIQRKVDKAMTSTKVYDSLIVRETQQEVHKSRRSRQRLMPLQEDQSNDDHITNLERDANDGIAIKRSTNFSTRSHDAAEEELRLTDREIYQSLGDYSTYCSTQEAIKREPDERISIFSSTQITKYIPSKFLSSNIAETKLMDRNLELLKNTLKFNAIPGLVFENQDDTWIGTNPHRLQDNLTSFLTDLPLAQFRLEWEINQKSAE